MKTKEIAYYYITLHLDNSYFYPHSKLLNLEKNVILISFLDMLNNEAIGMLFYSIKKTKIGHPVKLIYVIMRCEKSLFNVIKIYIIII